MQESSILDGRFVQIVVLPGDEEVKWERCTCRIWWFMWLCRNTDTTVCVCWLIL